MFVGISFSIKQSLTDNFINLVKSSYGFRAHFFEILYYFHQLPLLFLLANIVVIPLASLVLILGSITLLFNFIFNDLKNFLDINFSKKIRIKR